MDEEVIQKYKAGGGGEGGYRLVYESEGKDDPFGDMDFQYAEELGSEVAINFTGEVNMATAMDDAIEKILDDYGTAEEAASAAVYSQHPPTERIDYKTDMIIIEQQESKKKNEEEE